MDYRQVRLELKKGKLRPLYLFAGGEELLKEELLHIMLGIMKKGEDEPDLWRIDGRKTSWAELRRELAQITIFSHSRLLLVKDPPYFAASTGKKAGAKTGTEPLRENREGEAPAEHELAAILAAARDTLLVFSVQEVDRRRKLNKYLEKEGVLIYFPPLKGAALARWIHDKLKQQNRQIEEDALALLMQRSSEDLVLLHGELDKLITFLNDQRVIKRSHVEILVPENAQGNIFNMVDELGRKNAAAMLNHFYKMRRQNEPPLRILALVTRHFRLLYRARLLQQQGLAPEKLAAALKVPPFAAVRLQEQLPNFTDEVLPGIIAHLREVDLRIKTGLLSGEEAVEQLLYKLVFE